MDLSLLISRAGIYLGNYRGFRESFRIIRTRLARTNLVILRIRNERPAALVSHEPEIRGSNVVFRALNGIKVTRTLYLLTGARYRGLKPSVYEVKVVKSFSLLANGFLRRALVR